MYATRRKLFEESLEQTRKISPKGEDANDITRDSLEEEARQGSLKSASQEDKFWARQRGCISERKKDMRRRSGQAIHQC